ncbi:MAG TPA: D-alanyl-D-alanine carboxypeptidase/D-alanyl-D-alanine-endopeptidase [Gemmatimonadales bacterium]|jgi:D-alanyl-D-alanine carboxypeptidase/D-alanyl-D-alanine-endopeptidase (penicillin-binding protein 4)|nr:D-alanyl-D-alanine carboxypeptidase/D-alanyl-D-alanine-endopeptidase [Gemmatimonadales bacterium]
MRRCLAAVLLATLAPASVPAQSLAKRLDRLLDAAPFDRNHWGVVVMDTTGRVLYQRNGTRLFVPASNTKLVVTAAATALLPLDSTVATSLFAAGPVEAGILHGDLVLYGRGDPTMSRRCFDADSTRPGACETDPARRLKELAAQLKASGIRAVSGAVVGDGSYFEPALLHGTWEADDLVWWYAAPVSGLAFNDNSLDLRWGPGPEAGAPGRIGFEPDLGDLTIENRTMTVAEVAPGEGGLDVGRLGPLSLWASATIPAGGPTRTSYVALPDPDRYAASALRLALADAGIAVLGGTESTTDSMRYAAARRSPPLAETRSRPFREWLVPILGPSQNLFAEMLLKQVGRRILGEGSWRSGTAVEQRFLIDSVGVDSTQFSLRDGSGLSHVNVVSPLAFAKLLLWLRRHPNFPVVEAALPVAGRYGTLRNRMVGTAVEGRVKAKTGSIFRVNALSGYVTLPNGRTRIFSIQTNNHDLRGGAMTAQMDSVVVEIARR